MYDAPDTDRKAKGKYNLHIFLGIDSSEKRVGGQAFIHHREGDVLFKRIRQRPPLSPPVTNLTSRRLMEHFPEAPSNLRRKFRAIFALVCENRIEMGSRVRGTNDGPTPVTLRFWQMGEKV
ncbi:hypothetical protein CEXT_725811 [Caerostris extrusa]|uniref:Uncharacterized protein n=1 Tax=Caerostris extrusa TaxID=172846 RepID=A0AAV4XT99_CAEEX|nr:hypothetical protein CEXT_725811 [Caerostris extrusa]